MSRSHPFETRPLIPPSWLQRLFQRQPKENALIELNNLLAENISSVTENDLFQLSEKYRVNIRRRFRKKLAQWYADYLSWSLTDHKISPEEEENLVRLKALFDLNDRSLSQIHEEVARALYSKSVAEVIADDRVSLEERKFLEALEKDLKLPAETAQKIYREHAHALLKQTLDTAVADQRLSDEEAAELDAIAKSLGVEIRYDEKSRAALDRFRLYWVIENGALPQVPVEINLLRQERCHFQTYVKWHEMRRVTTGVRYSGPLVRIRVCKGVYWRLGESSIKPVSQEVLTLIDSGELFLTNKRLIFLGQKKNTTLRLQKILDIIPYRNGVEIQKESGRNPFLEFKQNIDIFCMMLERLMKEEG